MALAGDIIIGLGVIFIFFGVFGLFRFDNFYGRILVTAKIDTVGTLTFALGLAIKHGLSFFTFKLMMLVILMLVINPLATHIVLRSAYLSGYKIDDHSINDDDKKEEDL